MDMWCHVAAIDRTQQCVKPAGSVEKSTSDVSGFHLFFLQAAATLRGRRDHTDSDCDRHPDPLLINLLSLFLSPSLSLSIAPPPPPLQSDSNCG